MQRTSQIFEIHNIDLFKEQLLIWAQQYKTAVWLDSNNYQQKHSSFDAILAVDAFSEIETDYTHAFEHLYWQAAGKDHKTGKKSTLLQNFEKRYKEEFITFMKTYNTKNLWLRFKDLPQKDQESKTLIKAMRHYDYTVNITWVMAHYKAATHYILGKEGNGEATGGSDWQKYMHPKYQKRIFFPELWTKEEKDNWGHQ